MTWGLKSLKSVSDVPVLEDFRDILEICVGCSDLHEISVDLSRKVIKKFVFSCFSSLYSKKYIQGSVRAKYGVERGVRRKDTPDWRKDPQNRNISKRDLTFLDPDLDLALTCCTQHSSYHE